VLSLPSKRKQPGLLCPLPLAAFLGWGGVEYQSGEGPASGIQPSHTCSPGSPGTLPQPATCQRAGAGAALRRRLVLTAGLLAGAVGVAGRLDSCFITRSPLFVEVSPRTLTVRSRWSHTQAAFQKGAFKLRNLRASLASHLKPRGTEPPAFICYYKWYLMQC